MKTTPDRTAARAETSDINAELLSELRGIVRLIECPFDRASKKEAALLEAAEQARKVIEKEIATPSPAAERESAE